MNDITTLQQFRDFCLNDDVFNVEQSVNFIQSQSIGRDKKQLNLLTNSISKEIEAILEDDELAERLFSLSKDLENIVDAINKESTGWTVPIATGSMEFRTSVSPQVLHLVRIGDATFVRSLEWVK